MKRWAAGVVLGNRSVNPVIGSRLVDISYSDPDPARAQRIAARFRGGLRRFQYRQAI